jgi:hypothetical protein
MSKHSSRWIPFLASWRLALLSALFCGGLGCSQANSDPAPDSPFWGIDLQRSVTDLGTSVDLAKPPKDLAGSMISDQGGTPSSTLVINEVFSSGTDVSTDPDFIELYNGGSGQVNLRGYKVRDHNLTWATLPDDAVIPAGAYYLINCDGLTSGGLPGAHVPFKLGGSGDEAHLASPDGTELDSALWGKDTLDVPKGQSLARIPDFTGPFAILGKPTRGKPNL